MKRDMDLIVRILREVEARQSLSPIHVEFEDVDPEVLGRHIELLHDAGLIEGNRFQAMSDKWAEIAIKDLSWEGHDFLQAVENKTVWARMKEQVGADQIANLPFAVLKELGIAFTKQWLAEKTGISLG